MELGLATGHAETIEDLFHEIGYQVKELRDNKEQFVAEINKLRIEIAGKESVIKALEDDIQYYKKDWRTR